jgi:hypothetical protein
MYVVCRRMNTALSLAIEFPINNQQLMSFSLALKQRYFIPNDHQTSLPFTEQATSSDIDAHTFSLSIGEQYILSRVSVTKTRVWIGESVYWIFTSRNYN